MGTSCIRGIAAEAFPGQLQESAKKGLDECRSPTAPHWNDPYISPSMAAADLKAIAADLPIHPDMINVASIKALKQWVEARCEEGKEISKEIDEHTIVTGR